MPFRHLSRNAFDMLATGGGQGAVAIMSLLVYRWLAIRTGASGFAAYALVRQGAWLMFPVVMVGMTVALPRTLAVRVDASAGERELDLIGAIMVCGLSVAALSTALLFDPRAAASLIFGHQSRSNLVGPVVAMLGATVLYTLAFGYFRGCFQLRRGAVIQVLGLGVTPLLVVLLLSYRSTASLIYVMALVLAGISLIALLAPLARGVTAWRWQRCKDAIGNLVLFGYRRVPGDLAYLALFGLAPLAIAHAGSSADVAHFVAGQQLLLALHVFFMPVGLVLLPALSRLWETDRPAAREFVAQFAAFAAHVAGFALFQLLVLSGLFVQVWFGARFATDASIVQVVVVPAAAFGFYLALRSPLDAAALKSYNSRNNVIAVGCLAVTTATLLGLSVARPTLCIAWGFASGLTAQGLLTFVSVNRVFAIGLSQYQFRVALPLSAGCGAVALVLRAPIEHSGFTLPLMVLLELLLISAYVVALMRGNVEWPRFLANRMLARTAPPQSEATRLAAS